MTVGSKDTVEHSVPHIPFVGGVERVAFFSKFQPIYNICPLTNLSFRGHRSTVEKPHPRDHIFQYFPP